MTWTKAFMVVGVPVAMFGFLLILARRIRKSE